MNIKFVQQPKSKVDEMLEGGNYIEFFECTRTMSSSSFATAMRRLAGHVESFGLIPYLVEIVPNIDNDMVGGLRALANREGVMPTLPTNG